MPPKDKPYLAEISGWRTFVLLGLMLFLAYSNTFDVPWHFDDYSNILANPKVHAQYPRLSTLAEPFVSLFENGHLNRPFAMVTFAANWYLGKDNPFGYHAVNLAIHIFTAYFLFLTLLVLFQTPRLDGIYSRQQVVFVSLLAAALWAVNPIQVQAITYIVQRMASMCGMFYILSIFLYVKARLSRIFTRTSVLLYAACCLSFLAAFFTKENAALLPVTLLLIEAVFFQDLGRKKVRMTFLGIALALGIATVIGGAIVFYNGNPLAVLNYEVRLFSPLERLLTQPRILLFYLTLIFYPAPNRLSLVHDIDVSTSFFHPWTTLPSIIIVFALVGYAIYKLKKWPILSFAVLFFFLNHVIESSIIPLELIFEHRNYLPAMFLFWPVAAGLERLMRFYRSKNSIVYYGLVAFVPLLLVGMGTGTYVRNIDWSSEKYLWEDAMHKAPRSSRPNHNLAWSHYQRIGDHDSALVLYRRALEGLKTNTKQEPMIWNNIAGIYHYRGDFERAAQFWQKSHESSPRSVNPRYRLALALTKLDRLDEALSKLNPIFSEHPRYVQALNLKGVILWKQNQPREALLLFRKCIQLAPRNGRLLINIGASFHSLGDYRKAELFFKEALRRTARARIALLWRVKNQLEAGDGDASTIDADLDELLSKAPIDKLIAWLQKCFTYKIYKDEVLVPEKGEKLIESIKAQYRSKLDRFGG
jgi:tetratricopeptide (TPR) repeat protein